MHTVLNVYLFHFNYDHELWRDGILLVTASNSFKALQIAHDAGAMGLPIQIEATATGEPRVLYRSIINPRENCLD